MKQYFYFFFDKKDRFCCINECNYQYRKYKNDAAMDILTITDNINIQKIVIKNNKMNLFSNNNVIVIDDLNKFSKKKYLKLIPNIKNMMENSFRYNMLNNHYNLSFDITLYSDNYKNKMAIKSGIITLLSLTAIVGSISLHKAGINLKKEQMIAKDFCYTMEQNIENVNKGLEIVDNTSKYLEDKKIKEEEERIKKEEEAKEKTKKNYKNFSSYNDETKYAYDNYFDIVYEQTERIGVDPNLIMAMLIQESHGQRVNLMQISYSDWCNHSFEYFDFKDNEYKKMVLTDKDFYTPEGNIMAACLILRQSINHVNNNIMAGVQCYNLGSGNMDAVINATCAGENKTKEEILANQDDLLFVPYTRYARGGDKHYIKNISQFLNDTDYLYYLDIDEHNNIVEYKCNLNKNEKVFKML